MSDSVKILLVDDEQDILELLTMDFEAAGYDVNCASSGNEAFGLIQTVKPGLVISDLRMPNGGGIDLFNSVLKLPREVRPKMMFITGFPVISVDEAFDRGADGFVIKPFVRRELVAYVNRLLEPVPGRWTQPSSNKQEKIKKIIKLPLGDFETASKAHQIALGRGGMFISLSNDFPAVGDLIQFEVTFSDNPNNNIIGDGFVRWVRDQADNNMPKGIGIDFRSLQPEAIRFLTGEKKILELQPFIPRF